MVFRYGDYTGCDIEDFEDALADEMELEKLLEEGF